MQQPDRRSRNEKLQVSEGSLNIDQVRNRLLTLLPDNVRDGPLFSMGKAIETMGNIADIAAIAIDKTRSLDLGLQLKVLNDERLGTAIGRHLMNHLTGSTERGASMLMLLAEIDAIIRAHQGALILEGTAVTAADATAILESGTPRGDRFQIS